MDEWGEVVKYAKVLDNEAKLKEKQDYLMKQRLVKQTLDQQIKEQAKLRDQIKQEKI